MSGMTEPSAKALLPAGLSDVLPPEAEHEEATVQCLMAVFGSYGYQRVKPPLMEFEDNLLSGSGAALARQTFRLMDPVSQRMMGMRPDMTMQVARVATTRLAQAPRPLRLSYAGQVLRVTGSQLRPERQFGQVGAELVGSTSPLADVEVILMALAALRAAGIVQMTVDLALPTLVPALTNTLGIGAIQLSQLRAALDRKDASAVADMTTSLGSRGTLFEGLLAATGPAEPALQALIALDLPPAAAAERNALVQVANGMLASEPNLILTIDPVEHRGWEYHTGVAFTLFAPGVRGELGSGGRYQAIAPGANSSDTTQTGDDMKGEAATGLTLFMDTVMRALPAAKEPGRLFLPFGTTVKEAQRSRADGWIVISAIDSDGDAEAEAQRLECSHILENGGIVPVTHIDEEG
ncbi:MAG: ATP phosphoribosyltransferase regulatory subunit [Rhodospirillales bacterium]|jgi:ATP phosphoribosyltransferase regulatory subunit